MDSAGWRERKGGSRKVFASQEMEYRLELRFSLRRKTRRAAFQAEFQGALAWTTVGAILLPLCAIVRFSQDELGSRKAPLQPSGSVPYGGER
jgi:hypothetical protein